MNDCKHEWIEGCKSLGKLFYLDYMYSDTDTNFLLPNPELWTKNRICQLCKKEQVWIERGVFPQSTDGWL